MNFRNRSLLLISGLTLFICAIILFAINTLIGLPLKSTSLSPDTAREDSLYQHLWMKSMEAKSFCEENGFNQSFCFLVNFSVHSGKKRFYVWDFELSRAIDSGLVTHGCGQSWWGRTNNPYDPPFSNEYESHCSSPGKYKVGKRDYSQWGIHVKYLLHGLDSANCNALGRYIVLHSWEAVSEEEVFPRGSPESWGCPAVSNEFMTRLDKRLKSQRSPVLLWIFVAE